LIRLTDWSADPILKIKTIENNLLFFSKNKLFQIIFKQRKIIRTLFFH